MSTKTYNYLVILFFLTIIFGSSIPGKSIPSSYIFSKDKLLHIIVCGSGSKPYDYVTHLKNMNDCKLMCLSKNLGIGLLNPMKHKIDLEFFDENNNSEYKYSMKK